MHREFRLLAGVLSVAFEGLGHLLRRQRLRPPHWRPTRCFGGGYGWKQGDYIISSCSIRRVYLLVQTPRLRLLGTWRRVPRCTGLSTGGPIRPGAFLPHWKLNMKPLRLGSRNIRWMKVRVSSSPRLVVLNATKKSLYPARG